MTDDAAEKIIDTAIESGGLKLGTHATDPAETTVFLKCNLGAVAQAKLDGIQKETGASSARIFYNMLMAIDTSPRGLRALLPELFPTAETPADPAFLDVNEPTPCAVSIDIYGEEFNFRASRDEARRLIKTFERVNAARRNVTRLKRQLLDAEAASFNGVIVGAGAGIMVDDPDAGKSEAA